jgi:hypothetical protein
MDFRKNLMPIVFLAFSVLIDIGFMILLIKYMSSYDSITVEMYAITMIFNIIPLLLFNILLISSPYIKRNSESSSIIGAIILSILYLVVQTVLTIFFYSIFSIGIFLAVSLFVAAFSFLAITMIFLNMKKAASWGNTNSERLYNKMSDDDMDAVNQNYFKD